MKSLLVLLSFVMSVSAHAKSGVKIDWEFISDKEACALGRLTMDFKVIVGEETFKFSPSCRYSFDKAFKTKKKVQCKIAAGMCSSFSPRNKIEVKCGDGSEVSASVKCP